MIMAGFLICILVFIGIPLLILFLGLLFSGGVGTAIAIGAVLVALVIGTAVSA